MAGLLGSGLPLNVSFRVTFRDLGKYESFSEIVWRVRLEVCGLSSRDGDGDFIAISYSLLTLSNAIADMYLLRGTRRC